MILCKGPLCPRTPDVPEEGTVVNNPVQFEYKNSESCGLDGEYLELQCQSVWNIYIRIVISLIIKIRKWEFNYLMCILSHRCCIVAFYINVLLFFRKQKDNTYLLY